MHPEQSTDGPIPLLRASLSRRQAIRNFFLDLYSRTPPQFGAADIVCLGTYAPELLPEMVIPLLFGVRDDNGSNPVSEYVIILPPNYTDSERDESPILQLNQDSVERHLGRSLAAEEIDVLTKRLRVLHPRDLEVGSVIECLASIRARAVAFVCNCDLYRDPALSATLSTAQSQGARLEEDLWVPHVHALATQGTAIAVESEAYILFNVGEDLPKRAANSQLLMSVDACGLGGTDSMADHRTLLSEHADKWMEQVRVGHSDVAIASIDSLPEPLNRFKPIIKTQILYSAGRHAEAVEIVRSLDVASIDPDVKIKLARYAVEGEDTSLGRSLLESSLPRLVRQESLELALSVSIAVRSPDLERQCLERLQTLYPTSDALRQRRIRQFLINSQMLARDHAVSVDVAFKPADISDLQRAFAAATEVRDRTPNYGSILKLTGTRSPALVPIARLACGIHSLERGWPEITLEYTRLTGLQGEAELEGYGADLLLRALEGALVRRSAEFSAEGLIEPVAEVIQFLATHPEDAPRRVALARVLAVQSAGDIGLPITALATLILSGRQPTIGPKAPEEVLPLDASEEPLLRTYRAALEWAERNGRFELGKAQMPVEIFELSPDHLLARLKRMASAIAESPKDDSDFRALEQIIVVASLAAPHASERRNDDLEILRSITAYFAISGRHQKARDLAEQALQLAGTDPLRARIAWYTFADTYHRVKNLPEALLAMACALACEATISHLQLWYETNGLIRLLRDIGLVALARNLIPRADALLKEMGLAQSHGHRLETLELSVHVVGLKAEGASPAETQRLLSAIVANLNRVITARDEIAPVAALLAQSLCHCDSQGIPVDEAHRVSLDDALSRISPDIALLIRATSRPIPSSEDVLQLVQRLQAARYSEDIGFDVHLVVITAERLLSTHNISEQPVVAAFAIEIMADHGVTIPEQLREGAETSGQWLAFNLDTTAEVAAQLSRSGIDVAMLGLDVNQSLVHVTFRNSATTAVVREAPSVFSFPSFRQWAERYPYRYGIEEDIGNLFYTSQQRVGTTLSFGERTLLIMATPLQVLPANLLLVNGDLAGRTSAMAAAPSLTWLTAARNASRPKSGRRTAWIPSADSPSGRSGTLGMLADRLEQCLAEHHILLDTVPRVPDDMTHADLAIIGAHGRMGPEKSYLQSLADDDALHFSPVSLAHALAHVHVVILFVCSGGRADKHPLASTIVGLPKELLDRNCSAVVASPWPLDARVPSHWLPAFLDAWYAGVPLIDANFMANRAVQRAMGDSPALCLAMNVYGDPLAKAE